MNNADSTEPCALLLGGYTPYTYDIPYVQDNTALFTHLTNYYLDNDTSTKQRKPLNNYNYLNIVPTTLDSYQ
jgi:hypothetical protein